MTRSSKAGIAALGALLALNLSACGSGDNLASKSPADIVKTVTAAMKSLKSVHLSGSISSGGQEQQIDMGADTAGNCSGTMGIGGGTAHVLSVGGASYLKGDAAFWHAAGGSSGDQALALLGSKWAKMPSSSDFSQVCNLTKLFSKIGDVKGTLSKGATTTINGMKALEIISKDASGTTHIFVALDGAHYIVRADEITGTEPGSLTLSKFNEPIDAKAPASTDVVDLGAIGG